MKKRVILLAFSFTLLLACLLSSCNTIERGELDKTSPASVTEYLLEGNRLFVSFENNSGNTSSVIRQDTAENGQHPYVTVVTCSDSRVPPEHIFSAGVGELFVIRTAGNVIGNFELGSVEYGAEHLETSLVVVLGHTGCGAVDAALNGGAHGAIKDITDEINSALPEGVNATEAEILNVRNSIDAIMQSEIIAELVSDGRLSVVGAIYNIETGYVEFLD